MTSLAHFADAYNAIRRSADRGLDLDEVRIETSIVEAKVVEQGLTYVGVSMKGVDEGARIADVLCKREGRLVLHVQADLEQAVVRFIEGDPAVLDEVVGAFAVDSDNALETLDYLDRQPDQDNPAKDLYESDRQKGSLLARCILAGLVEPHLTMTPTMAAAVGLAVVAELKTPAAFNQAGRYERALRWAARPDTQPEWGLFAVSSLLRAQQTASETERAALDEVLQGEAWVAFNARFKGSLLQGVLHGGHGPN